MMDQMNGSLIAIAERSLPEGGHLESKAIVKLNKGENVRAYP